MKPLKKAGAIPAEPRIKGARLEIFKMTIRPRAESTDYYDAMRAAAKGE